MHAHRLTGSNVDVNVWLWNIRLMHKISWHLTTFLFAVLTVLTNDSMALDVPEVPTPELAIAQCTNTKTFTVKKKVDVQKAGSIAWKANGNSGAYPLPPTFEYVVESKRGKTNETHTCKVQRQPSGKWKLIDGVLWDQP